MARSASQVDLEALTTCQEVVTGQDDLATHLEALAMHQMHHACQSPSRTLLYHSLQPECVSIISGYTTTRRMTL
jgi:hypothetical protein